MIARPFSAGVLAACFGCALLVGCSGDAQGFGPNDVCPEQPLYHYELLGDGGKAVPVDSNGKPLTQAQLDAIKTASSANENDKHPYQCGVTAAGSAMSPFKQ